MTLEKNVKDILKGEAVETTPDGLSQYHVTNPLLKNNNNPKCAARPKDSSELKKLIKKANETGMGLVPVSSSGRHYKGGISCAKDHVMVDLSSWKNIPWLNKRNRVCLIEPGVTYGELTSKLKGQGMTLSMPLAPRNGKSVLAATMDREPSTWPNKQWDYVDPVASTEFFFGTGDIFTTGSAGGPGTLEDQRKAGGAHKCSLGPSQTEFQRILQGAQGSMGITTWISLRTEFIPEVEEPRILGSDNLSSMIGYVYDVQRPWLGEQSFILNRHAVSMLMTSSDNRSLDGLEQSLPQFICLQNIAGFRILPQERVDYQLKNIGEIAGKHKMVLKQKIGKLFASDLLKKATTPCGEKDWRQVPKGDCLSVFFVSTLNRAEHHFSIFRDAAKNNGIEEEEIGIYFQPVVQNHACHMEFMVPYNSFDETEFYNIKNLEEEAFKKLNAAHAFFSRPYGNYTNKVFDNNPANKMFLKNVKEIFDPNHILNPGKFGL